MIRSGLCPFTLAATEKINYDGARVLSASVCSVSAHPKLISRSAKEREMDLPWLVSGSAGFGALAGWRLFRLQYCTSDEICIAQMKKRESLWPECTLEITGRMRLASEERDAD